MIDALRNLLTIYELKSYGFSLQNPKLEKEFEFELNEEQSKMARFLKTALMVKE